MLAVVGFLFCHYYGALLLQRLNHAQELIFRIVGTNPIETNSNLPTPPFGTKFPLRRCEVWTAVGVFSCFLLKTSRGLTLSVRFVPVHDAAVLVRPQDWQLRTKQTAPSHARPDQPYSPRVLDVNSRR